MALLLGIDGGGTGCRAAVADAAGRILGTGQAGPANISSDLASARANILSAAQDAIGQALSPGQTKAELPDLLVGMGLAGANAAGVVGRFIEGLPFRHIRVETDAIAAVKGALQDNDGIVAAIGTGSVFARQTGGAIRQIGGWGLILGDEASGAWIGRALLSATLGAAQGFQAPTPLTQGLLDELGGTDGIIRFSLTARPSDFAAFAPRVLASDDPVARRIMDHAVADAAASVAVLQGSDPVPITFIGGLGPAYSALLSDRWPQQKALGTALDGALHLARGLL